MRYQVYGPMGEVVAQFRYRSDAQDFAENYHWSWGTI